MIKISSPDLIRIRSRTTATASGFFNPDAVALQVLLLQVYATTHLSFGTSGPAFGLADALRVLGTGRSAHAGRFHLFIFGSAGAAATATSGFLLITGLS